MDIDFQVLFLQVQERARFNQINQYGIIWEGFQLLQEFRKQSKK